MEEGFNLYTYLFFFSVTFSLLGALIASVNSNSDFQSLRDYQYLIIKSFEFLSAYIVFWFFVKFIDNESLKDSGFSIKNRRSDIINGMLIGLLIMTFGYFLLLLLDEIIFVESKFSMVELLYSILLYIVVALLEEMLIRGYVLRNLMYSFNKYIALMTSSLLFALMHGLNPNIDWFGFLNLFLAGILLGASYIHTRNLWFPIALHFSWNFFQTLLGFNVSGQDTYSLIIFKMPEKNMLNGGDFGFEGSIFSVIIQVLLIIGIYVYYRRKDYHKSFCKE